MDLFNEHLKVGQRLFGRPVGGDVVVPGVNQDEFRFVGQDDPVGEGGAIGNLRARAPTPFFSKRCPIFLPDILITRAASI